VSGQLRARIVELGNGFPNVGDYVSDDEGALYRVLAFVGNVETDTFPGAPNWVRAEVERASWDDCDEDTVFHGQVGVEAE